MSDTTDLRMRRKLQRRDRRIAGMQRRIALLESALASRVLEIQTLPRDIERAVTRALCNVRMIPVHGIGGGTKIVEVRALDEKHAGPPPPQA